MVESKTCAVESKTYMVENEIWVESETCVVENEIWVVESAPNVQKERVTISSLWAQMPGWIRIQLKTQTVTDVHGQ